MLVGNVYFISQNVEDDVQQVPFPQKQLGNPDLCGCVDFIVIEFVVFITVAVVAVLGSGWVRLVLIDEHLQVLRQLCSHIGVPEACVDCLILKEMSKVGCNPHDNPGFLFKAVQSLSVSRVLWVVKFCNQYDASLAEFR